MSEFKKILSLDEIKSGLAAWSPDHDAAIKELFLNETSVEVLFDGKIPELVKVDYEKRAINLGKRLMQAAKDSQLVIADFREKNHRAVSCRLMGPTDRIVIRKRLSLNEFKHRHIKWYARENDLYRRLFDERESFAIEICGRRIFGRAPDFEKRNLVVGEMLRCFCPGDDLLIKWRTDSDMPVLVFSKEEQTANVANEAMTSVRAIVTRLLSRPLGEFNEGEIKGLIVLLDENKKLWERLVELSDENQKLKEQVGTLESVFEQFARNTFFNCQKDFEEWVADHLNLFEKGLRILHRDHSVKLQSGEMRRLDLLCQDKKGVLVIVEIAFNPSAKGIEAIVELTANLQQNVQLLGKELTGGVLQATAIRGILVTNIERPETVETCLQKGIKLCVVNAGCVLDIIE